MMDIGFVENPAKKNIRNMYLNDYNYFHKNNIRMRHQKLGIFKKSITTKKLEKITHPVPKMGYSCSDFQFRNELDKKAHNANVANGEKKINQVKPGIDDFINLVDNFNISIDTNFLKDNDDFFITKPELNENVNLQKAEEEAKNVKVSVANEIYDDKKVAEIKENEKNFKDNLQFENYEKYKFSKSGIGFPEKYEKNKVPEYQGNDKVEKEYFEYRKKLKYPNGVYNKLDKFDEKFNKDLGAISNTYGKTTSRGRFAKNPGVKKYMDMIPVYDIYKEIKSIENRYTDSRFKYKMLPLINSKIRSGDKLAEKVYRDMQVKNGGNSGLSIQNEHGKNK